MEYFKKMVAKIVQQIKKIKFINLCLNIKIKYDEKRKEVFARLARKTYEELNELKKKYNNIIIEEEYSFIELKNRKKEITGYAIIDTEDIELILEYRWYKSKDGYAVYADRLKKFNTSYNNALIRIGFGFKISRP